MHFEIFDRQINLNFSLYFKETRFEFMEHEASGLF